MFDLHVYMYWWTTRLTVWFERDLFSEIILQDVVDDVQGALKAGLKGILVQTGKYKKGDEDKIEPKPTAVVPSFVEAVEKILDMNKGN